MKILMFSILISMIACDRIIPINSTSHPSTPISAELGKPFDLPIGQEITIQNEDLVIRFDSLIGDSRCPLNALCVWEGDGAILISARQDNTTGSGELHTHSGGEGALLGYKVVMTDLRPYPLADIPVDITSYAVTLVITKP